MSSFHWLFVVSLLFVGCTLFEAKDMTYLRQAQDRATQEEVRERLGAPALIKAAPAGESTWVYEIRQEQSGSRITAPGMWCDEYVLTFDSQGVLRQWTHRSQFHGGEVMPTYCVSDGFKPAS
jgi:outer membrane protein assembly factor BamE (lipoprotein component of BamABCDE complex)